MLAPKSAELTRLFELVRERETGMITANRSFVIEHQEGINAYQNGTLEEKAAMSKYPENAVTRMQNLKRNSQLREALLRKKYTIQVLRGEYIESYGETHASQEGEVIFLVVDTEDQGRLETDLWTLGKRWFQDSVLYFPKGGSQGILFGTNQIASYPGFENRHRFDHPVFDSSGGFITEMNDRPFVFGQDVQIITTHTYKQMGNIMGEWARQKFIDSDWRDLPEDCSTNKTLDYLKEYANSETEVLNAGEQQ